MYATGVRLNEVVRLRYRDIDFDPGTLCIWEGKGRSDRIFTLPDVFRVKLQTLTQLHGGDAYLFPSTQSADRYLSPRTVQRIMKATKERAGILKPATPHTLLHSFATHSFENGCDIRLIQKSLGHVPIETTTIYVHIAQWTSLPTSPLDQLMTANKRSKTPPTQPTRPTHCPKLSSANIQSYVFPPECSCSQPTAQLRRHVPTSHPARPRPACGDPSHHPVHSPRTKCFLQRDSAVF